MGRYGILPTLTDAPRHQPGAGSYQRITALPQVKPDPKAVIDTT